MAPNLSFLFVWQFCVEYSGEGYTCIYPVGNHVVESGYILCYILLWRKHKIYLTAHRLPQLTGQLCSQAKGKEYTNTVRNKQTPLSSSTNIFQFQLEIKPPHMLISLSWFVICFISSFKHPFKGEMKSNHLQRKWFQNVHFDFSLTKKLLIIGIYKLDFKGLLQLIWQVPCIP